MFHAIEISRKNLKIATAIKKEIFVKIIQKSHGNTSKLIIKFVFTTKAVYSMCLKTINISKLTIQAKVKLHFH